MALVRLATRVLVLSTQARSRLLRHGSSQDFCLRDCTATAAPADDHLASSSEQLDRRAARGIWTAGESIVKLLSFERPSWSRTGPARSARPDWPAAAPPRRRPADLLPASTRAPGDVIRPVATIVRYTANHSLLPSLPPIIFFCHPCPRACSSAPIILLASCLPRPCLALKHGQTGPPFCVATSYSKRSGDMWGEGTRYEFLPGPHVSPLRGRPSAGASGG